MGIEPTHAGTTIRCVNHFTTTAMLLEWFRTESNRRHCELQSHALPTELLNLGMYSQKNNGGPDGNRTRDLLRDRQAC